MAKDKDRALNPAAAQRKLEKQKALKKGKAQVAAQRTERLAHRNPHRLESQISDLHALKDSSGGKLSARDQKQLEELERDVTRVKKARDTLGDEAPRFGQRSTKEGATRGNERGRGGRANYGGLGKRSRADGGREEEEDEGEDNNSEETDEDVRRIPWPKDTPPPVPRPERERQWQRRDHRGSGEGTSANREPLGVERYPKRDIMTEEDTAAYVPDTSLPAKPTTAAAATPSAVVKTYESKAQVRDLRKEATARFVPSAVRRKIDATKGVGGKLLEEDEVRKLEEEGYGLLEGNKGRIVDEAAIVEEVGDDEEARRLREEEEAFQRVLGAELAEEDGEVKEQRKEKRAEVEDVSDEDL